MFVVRTFDLNGSHPDGTASKKKVVQAKLEREVTIDDDIETYWLLLNSSEDEEKLGIWLGPDPSEGGDNGDHTRYFPISREEAAEMATLLNRYVETGKLP